LASSSTSHPSAPTSQAIQLLYQDWDHSDNRSWVIFCKYLETFNNVSIHQTESPTDYIFKASLNGSREKMKEFSSRQIMNKVLFNEAITLTHIRQVLPALLDQRTSMGALMTVSRTNEAHRIKNHTSRLQIPVAVLVAYGSEPGMRPVFLRESGSSAGQSS
jgi:hypothetical protein